MESAQMDTTDFDADLNFSLTKKKKRKKKVRQVVCVILKTIM